MIFIDSSFYISLTVHSDSNHRKAEQLAKHITVKKITSEDILKESLTVVSQRKGRATAMRLYEQILTDTEILSITSDRFHRGLDIFLRTELQKDISLIDCITAAIAAEIGVTTILTFDRHFKTMGFTVRP